MRHEFELGRRVARGPAVDYVVRHLALETAGSRLALVMEDFGGETLANQVRSGGLPLLHFVDLATRMARAVQAMHDAALIHRDISPANMLLKSDSLQLRFCDLSEAIATDGAPKADAAFHGCLTYAAPEQTQRTGWGIDQRADLYSLGVTLFELLIGQLPFAGVDALETFHRHLAWAPPSPQDLRPDVPEALAAILLRLLNKNPDERYRSAAGLHTDLIRCHRQLVASGTITAFTLAENDPSPQFALPRRLFGREAELAVLTGALDRAAAGDSAFVIVRGKPGVGKSMLVNELRNPTHDRGGHFCAGKFEPVRESVPYGAFCSALRSLLLVVLARPADELQRWRDRVGTALGANGALLTTLVPELQVLVGVQAEVPSLGPEQAHERFRRVVLRLIEAIANAEKPLVLFFDDLQWADQASLALIEQLISAETVRGLAFIGAFRDAEVDAAPWASVVERLRACRGCVDLALGPLELSDVEKLVETCLGQSRESCQPLAHLVWRKTDGEAFFVAQFLRMLHADRLLWFDPAVRGWRWEEAACEGRPMTDNVVAMMLQRLTRLPHSSRHALQRAACIGSQFDVDTLETVLQLPREGLAAALDSALAEGLIINVIDEGSPGARRLRFLHDHVQEAVYADIGSDRASLHLTIGRLLFDAFTEKEREERAFELLNHFYIGLHLIVEPEECRRVAEVCLSGGRRAKGANAYESATRYLKAGIGLLGDAGWQEAHDLTLALHREYAEAAYLSGSLEQMETTCAGIIESARHLLDRVPAWHLRMLAHIARYEMQPAIDVARRILGELGIQLPVRPGRIGAMTKVTRTVWRMRGETPRTLLARPRMTDRRALAAMQLLALASSPAYLTSPHLFPVIVCEMVELSLHYGNSEWATSAYLGWGAIQIAGFNSVRRGHELAAIAPMLIEELNVLPHKGRTQAIYHLLIHHWVEPLRSTIAPLRTAIYDSLEHGDLSYASVAATTEAFHTFASGTPLPEVEEMALAHEGLLRGLGQERYKNDMLRIIQLIRCFRGNAPDPRRLQGEFFDEDQALQTVAARGDRALIACSSYERALLRYVHDDAAGALQHCRVSSLHIESVLGTAYPPLLDFLSALVRLRLLTEAHASVSASIELPLVRQSLRRLKSWAKGSPRNHEHRVWLIGAELARLRGQADEATRHYERAIDVAQRNGYTQEQAMALECAARYYSSRSQRRIAAATLLVAREAWLAWGATAKAALLDAEFPELLLQPRLASLATEQLPLRTNGESVLDVASVVKASQAIMSEIHLPHLVQRLLALAMENTGAQRGFLILRRDGKLWVEAAADVDGENRLGPISLPLADVAPTLLASLIVEYVARVAEPMLHADVTSDPRFARDAYIATNRPLSVLCVPLVAQGRLGGVVYLENNRLRGAFTPARLELLRVLSAQAAIALENAELYANLKDSHLQQLRVAEAQSRFVPAEFLRSLNRQSILDVALGDNVRKEMSILFSDVRDFTALVEQMSPDQHIPFINGYLGHMEPAVLQHGGYIDSYIGDAIMALFEGEADHAVRAAIAMSDALRGFNELREEKGLAPIRMGVGISTGQLTLGTIGGAMRIKCGVIGDAVNLAARIESLTKQLGAFLLIGDDVRQKLRDPARFDLRFVDHVRVKGRAASIRLYEVLDAEPPSLRDAKRKGWRRFDEAMELYGSREFAAAERLFGECLAAEPRDGAAACLSRRCSQYKLRTPDNWDGVTVLSEK